MAYWCQNLLLLVGLWLFGDKNFVLLIHLLELSNWNYFQGWKWHRKSSWWLWVTEEILPCGPFDYDRWGWLWTRGCCLWRQRILPQGKWTWSLLEQLLFTSQSHAFCIEFKADALWSTMLRILIQKRNCVIEFFRIKYQRSFQSSFSFVTERNTTKFLSVTRKYLKILRLRKGSQYMYLHQHHHHHHQPCQNYNFSLGFCPVIWW